MHIIGIGDFGAAVAERLAALQPGSTVTALADNVEPRIEPARLPRAEGYVVASWRYVPDTMETVDRLCAAWRVPWMPIWGEPPTVRIGPLNRPGVICHTCAHRRSLQHSPTGHLTKALHEHYRTDRSAGPTGYLGAAATLTAGLAQHLIDHHHAAPAPQAYYLHVSSMRVVRGSVSPVHGCATCFPERVPIERTHLALRPVVSQLLDARASVR